MLDFSRLCDESRPYIRMAPGTYQTPKPLVPMPDDEAVEGIAQSTRNDPRQC
jgi:hypothetical protein